jgi:hypothetical protein
LFKPSSSFMKSERSIQVKKNPSCRERIGKVSLSSKGFGTFFAVYWALD